MDEKKNINSSLSAESHQHPGMEIKVSCASNLKLDLKQNLKKNVISWRVFSSSLKTLHKHIVFRS